MVAIKKCNLCERLFVSRLSLACLNCESNNNNTKISTPPHEHHPIKNDRGNAATISNPEKATPTKFTNSKKPKKPRAARTLQRTVVKKSAKTKIYEKLLQERTSAATHQENIIRKSLVSNYTNTTTPTAEPSIGEMIKSAGKLISNHLTQKYISPCSCQGINQNCFKCNGSGYCERDIITTPSSHKKLEGNYEN
jgi:hypothetical protein